MTEDPRVPPSKGHEDENFPVGSRLIAPHLRAPILAFYRFVRAADDVADAADLSSEEKLRRLDAMDAALVSGDAAFPLAARLFEADRKFGTGVAEARRLIEAFRQDAVKKRYADWLELLSYCDRSANPVGRFLLRLHGEDEAGFACSDPLCTALQILNHLQDLSSDRDQLDRVYMPEPWMARAGGEVDFFKKVESPSRRAVLDAALDRVDDLIEQAESLPARLRDRRLMAESAVTVGLARRLAAKLRKGDPILTRVALKPLDFAQALAEGVRRTAVRRFPSDSEIAAARARRSGSSFSLGMASLKGERRRGIYAVYAFCRAIDDIADGASPADEKKRFLKEWRVEIDGTPQTPIGREVAWARETFDLPRDELHALIDGMETDAADRVRLPDDAALDLYCRRVAGAVGALSIRVFGAPNAEEFALGLGETLQIVNVLRDVDEDAALERVYVPLSRLPSDGAAAAIVRAEGFAQVCEELSKRAAEGFAEAERRLLNLDRAKLKPAVLMMGAYRRLFERLVARGWKSRGERARLTKMDKMRLLIDSQRI